MKFKTIIRINATCIGYLLLQNINGYEGPEREIKIAYRIFMEKLVKSDDLADRGEDMRTALR
jgi:hypothetical protein